MRVRPASILLFFSGATALVYQALWVRQLSLVVGSDLYALTTAISAFFAGLALGSAVWGRYSDRTGRPVLLYAALEAGAALTAGGASFALAASPPLFAAMQSAAGPAAWLLPFFLIGLPAFFMGGTLPALVRAETPQDGFTGRTAGLLYAANTAGAVAGVLAATFALVPAFGIRGTALGAAAVNLALATAAVCVSRGLAPAPPARTDTASSTGAAPAILPLALYTVAGAIAMGYEVVWSRAMVQFLGTRAHAFSVMLATYLLGLVLGSALYARIADRVRRPWMAFGLLIGASGAGAAGIFAALGAWLPHAQSLIVREVLSATGSMQLAMCMRFAFASAVAMLLPTVLLGAAFPAAVRLAADAGHVGRDLGRVAAMNTLGGIAGTLATGFVLVPAFGLVRTLGALATGAVLLGAVAVAREAQWRLRTVIAASLLAAALAAAIAQTPHDKLARMLAAAHGGTLVFHEESPGGTVTVLELGTPPKTTRRLFIDGVSNSGDALTPRRYMRLQALLPLMIHGGEPRSALVVGLGAGLSTGALLAFPGLEKRTCIELLPAVARAASLFEGNFDCTRDPRIALRLADARHELQRSRQRYDLITMEPPPPPAAGIANLYSRDFYRLCRARLAPGGIVVQWWPLPSQNDEDSRSIVRAFLDVFPHATLWTTSLHDTMLLGSASPIGLDVNRIAARFAQGNVSAALRETGIGSPAALLATYVTDRAGLERYAAGAPPVTDDRPIIEYSRWVRAGEFFRVLPRVLALHTGPPLAGASDALRRQIETERLRLMDFYQAGLEAYAGNQERRRAIIDRLVAEDPDNPYFRWYDTDER